MAEKSRKKRQLKEAVIKPAKTDKKADKISKRSLIGRLLSPFRLLRVFRFLVPSYFKNSFKEMRHVSWPSRKETLRLTFAVFMFAIVFGALITVLDYGLDQLFKKVLLK